MYRVALLIETSRATGRGLLRGIFRYARLHGSWSFHLLPGDVDQSLPAMKAWKGTGIIARVWTPQIERTVVESHLPVVAVSLNKRQRQKSHPLSRFPAVVADQMGVGRVAADHLRTSGYVNFGYCGDVKDLDWSRERGEAFQHFVEKADKSCSCYWRAPRGSEDWGREQKHMIHWLRRLPKPVGILSSNDVRGRQVIEACHAANLKVPEDVGVLGMDNDELQCELTDPPLSSLAMNSEVAGYRAAEVLHRMMDGKNTKPVRILIEPAGAVRRRSTELDCSSDTRVADAMRYIRANAGKPIQVTEVSVHVGLSRRTLEQRFRKLTGQTLLAAIHQARFEIVRNHLLGTRLSVAEIAEKMGFSSSSYLARLCRRYLGQTPDLWRRKHGDVSRPH